MEPPRHSFVIEGMPLIDAITKKFRIGLDIFLLSAHSDNKAVFRGRFFKAILDREKEESAALEKQVAEEFQKTFNGAELKDDSKEKIQLKHRCLCICECKILERWARANFSISNVGYHFPLLKDVQGEYVPRLPLKLALGTKQEHDRLMALYHEFSSIDDFTFFRKYTFFQLRSDVSTPDPTSSILDPTRKGWNEFLSQFEACLILAEKGCLEHYAITPNNLGEIKKDDAKKLYNAGKDYEFLLKMQYYAVLKCINVIQKKYFSVYAVSVLVRSEDTTHLFKNVSQKIAICLASFEIVHLRISSMKSFVGFKEIITDCLKSLKEIGEINDKFRQIDFLLSLQVKFAEVLKTIKIVQAGLKTTRTSNVPEDKEVFQDIEKRLTSIHEDLSAINMFSEVVKGINGSFDEEKRKIKVSVKGIEKVPEKETATLPLGMPRRQSLLDDTSSPRFTEKPSLADRSPGSKGMLSKSCHFAPVQFDEEEDSKYKSLNVSKIESHNSNILSLDDLRKFKEEVVKLRVLFKNVYMLLKKYRIEKAAKEEKIELLKKTIEQKKVQGINNNVSEEISLLEVAEQELTYIHRMLDFLNMAKGAKQTFTIIETKFSKILSDKEPLLEGRSTFHRRSFGNADPQN